MILAMERTFVALAGVRKGSGGRVDNLDVDLGLCVHVGRDMEDMSLSCTPPSTL